MTPIDKIKKFIKNTNINTDPDTDRKVLNELLAELESAKSPDANSHPDVWRMIMNNKITKYAAAAIVLLAVILSLTVIEKTTPVAIADIVKAMHSVRYLHLKIIRAESEGIDEAWIQFDHIGNVQNIRMQIYSQTEAAAEGPKVAVWKEGKAKVWIKEKNVLMTVPEQDAADQILNAVIKLDPKHAIENVYEGQKKGDLVLDFHQPANKTDPIIIDVEVPAEGRLLILSIDQATKLLSSFEIHLLEDGEYKYQRTIEFHDYNQPIDPAMFVLEDEIPEDVIIIDQTDGPVGLEQGDLSDEEIAVEIVRQFFEAMVAKDYAAAGVLLSGISAEQMELLYGRLNIVEIVSIEQATTTSVDKIFKVPCVLNVEKDGQITQWSPEGPFVRQVENQPGRWEIMGGL